MLRVALKEYQSRIEGLIEENRLPEAAAHCHFLLQQYPRHIGTYRLFGRALLEQQQYNDTVDIFTRVISADPEDLLAHAGLALAYREKQDLPRALWHMTRAFEMEPYNGAIQNELRDLNERSGRGGVRVDGLNKAALARIYFKGGLYSKAVTETKSLLEVFPNRYDLQVLLADIYFWDNRRQDADQLCHLIIDELPYCMKANAILADLRLRSGRFREAKEHLSKLQSVALMSVSDIDPESTFGRVLINHPDISLPEQITVDALGEIGPASAQLSYDSEWIQDISDDQESEATREVDNYDFVIDTSVYDKPPQVERVEDTDWLEEITFPDVEGSPIEEALLFQDLEIDSNVAFDEELPTEVSKTGEEDLLTASSVKDEGALPTLLSEIEVDDLLSVSSEVDEEVLTPDLSRYDEEDLLPVSNEQDEGTLLTISGKPDREGLLTDSSETDEEDFLTILNEAEKDFLPPDWNGPDEDVLLTFLGESDEEASPTIEDGVAEEALPMLFREPGEEDLLTITSEPDEEALPKVLGEVDEGAEPDLEGGADTESMPAFFSDSDEESLPAAMQEPDRESRATLEANDFGISEGNEEKISLNDFGDALPSWTELSEGADQLTQKAIDEPAGDDWLTQIAPDQGEGQGLPKWIYETMGFAEDMEDSPDFELPAWLQDSLDEEAEQEQAGELNDQPASQPATAEEITQDIMVSETESELTLMEDPTPDEEFATGFPEEYAPRKPSVEELLTGTDELIDQSTAPPPDSQIDAVFDALPWLDDMFANEVNADENNLLPNDEPSGEENNQTDNSTN